MRGLPVDETHKTFRLLITLLGISDGRRRASAAVSAIIGGTRISEILRSSDPFSDDAAQPGLAVDGRIGRHFAPTPPVRR
jgi:hypothetical protein